MNSSGVRGSVVGPRDRARAAGLGSDHRRGRGRARAARGGAVPGRGDVGAGRLPT